MDFEDLLEAVGSFGAFQKKMIYGFLIPISLTGSFICMGQIFMLSAPPHGCYEPTISSFMDMSAEERKEIVRPLQVDEALGTTYKSCSMYNISYEDALDQMVELGMNVSEYVANFSRGWGEVPCRNGWDYDQSLYKRTVVTQWNLVCDNSYMVSMVYSVSTLGTSFGTPVMGSLSDRIGRRLTFMIGSVIAAVATVVCITIPSFVGFTVTRVIIGGVLSAAFQLPLLILLEIVSPEKRTRMNGTMCVFWTVGLASMPLVAWLTADWVYMGWFSAVLIAPYFAYYWFLPESPRWLISRDRYEEAADTLERIARDNGKDVSHLDLIAILKKCSHLETEKKNEQKVNPLHIFKNAVLRKLFCFVCMCWIADAMTYNLFQMNVSALHGNEFLNFFFLALVEFPSYLTSWYVMETKLGRRWSHVIFLLLTGIVCLLPITSPAGAVTFITVASMAGKFFVSAAFMVMYQQTAEVFPTPLRASGLAIAATIASVISIATPNLIYLSKYNRHIPYTVIAIICLTAGVAALFIPETLNENLPQTIQDAEIFGIGKKFFSFANTSKPDSSERVRKLSGDISDATDMEDFVSQNKNNSMRMTWAAEGDEDCEQLLPQTVV